VSFLELERQLKQRQQDMGLFHKPPILDLSEFQTIAVGCGTQSRSSALYSILPNRPALLRWYHFFLVGSGMSQDEVQAAAVYLNNLGVIVHFRESSSARDVVIIDPQFLTRVHDVAPARLGGLLLTWFGIWLYR